MKEKISIPEYLYHATRQLNLESILVKKCLAPIGKRINGYDEDTISLSDILTDYVIHYGDAVIKFRAQELFEKNKIYPYNYGINENDPEFYNMPFWESEWRAKGIRFDYSEIDKIYLISHPLLTTIKVLKDKNIMFKVISPSNLPSYSEKFLVKKYKERIKIAKSK